MSILLSALTWRVLPVAASLLLHAVAYGAILLAPGWTYTRESVVLADLVAPDPAPPAPEKKPAPPTPAPRPLTPPRPIETAVPRMPETAESPPPAPAPVAPTPAPAPPAPAAPTGHGPRVPVDAPLGATPDARPTQSGPRAPAGPAPSVAALPSDGVTRTAAPRGGYQVTPSYPTSARRAGIQGTTLLSVFVDADGRVADVVVTQSAGHPDLDAAAADAVRRWRFEPARRGAEAVAIWVLLPIEFRLR